jgi:cholinesterase
MIRMKVSVALSLCCLVSFLRFSEGATVNSTGPSATVKNGTYVGKYVPEWQQDQFLGIPFAIPPVGPLRFAWPKSLDSSFTGTRNATEYGYSCMQYGTNFSLSEDCLTLNGKTSETEFLH